MPISPDGMTYDDEEIDALFRAVGSVVVLWGQAEHSLDMIVAILHQGFGGKQIEKRIPQLLSPKLEYLSKCLSKIPSLAKFQSEGESLISNFRKLSEKRHDLVHGAIASLSLQDGAFIFTKLDIKNDFHVMREFRLDSSDYPAFTQELIELGAQSTAFAQRLKDFFLGTTT